MSTLQRLVLHRRSVPLVTPFVTAVRRTDAVDALIVEAVDSDGRSGWGEAPTSWRVTGESVASVTAAVEGPLRDAVLGLGLGAPGDPGRFADALSRAVVGNASACSAVECALCDLAAQSAGLPLARWLARRPFGTSAGTCAEDAAGAGIPLEVGTDMTLSAPASDAGIAELAARARSERDRGFRTLKVKAGAGADDVRAILAVRAAIGAEPTLRVDANQGWNARHAIDILDACQSGGADLQLVEQPVPRDDIDALAVVTAHSRARVGVPILADESVWTARQAAEVLSRRAADAVNIKLAKTGGLREALRVLDVVATAGSRAIVGCMMESHVGIGAAAALAAVIEERGLSLPGGHDLDAGMWLAESPIDGGVEYAPGLVRLADAPGTGVRGLR
jgi:L-alanine-DL-glutamate epimerase-like enolase superfamily enzyme